MDGDRGCDGRDVGWIGLVRVGFDQARVRGEQPSLVGRDQCVVTRGALRGKRRIDQARHADRQRGIREVSVPVAARQAV